MLNMLHGTGEPIDVSNKANSFNFALADSWGCSVAGSNIRKGKDSRWRRDVVNGTRIRYKSSTTTGIADVKCD